MSILARVRGRLWRKFLSTKRRSRRPAGKRRDVNPRPPATPLMADIHTFAVQHGLWVARSEVALNVRGAGYSSANHTGWSCIRGRNVPLPRQVERRTATRSGESFLCWKPRQPIGNKQARQRLFKLPGGRMRRLKHSWARPGTGGGAKSTLVERRLVVTLLADRIGLREDAVVNRARFSNQADPLEFGLWNKSNDLTHVRLQNWDTLSL